MVKNNNLDSNISFYEKNWSRMYNLAKAYYEHYNNLNIPYQFKTLNGYDYDENGYNLSNWLNTQRIAYVNRKRPERKNLIKPLSDEKVQKLLNIGMIFDVFTSKWNKMYNLAKSYYEHHNNLNVPYQFKTLNGYDYDENGYNLSNWLNTQRIAYVNRKRPQTERKNVIKPLSDEKVQKLLNIGMIFDYFDREWNKMYKLAKAYYEHYNNLNITRRFKTFNGYDYDENGYHLGNWINRQRCSYANRNIPKEERKKIISSLSDEKVQKLLEIGMIFDYFDSKWNKMYKLAKTYYEHYNNLIITHRFRTFNGYDYDKNGYHLGNWISTQRRSYANRNIPKEERKNLIKPLSDEKVQKLLNIGMIFDVYTSEWDRMYNLAKSYYEHYNNLNIPYKFKTFNGYDYDEKGYCLGSWINNQRIAYVNRERSQTERENLVKPLSDERVQKLLSIGMIFQVKKNILDIKELCQNMGINYKNSLFLKKCPYQEVEAKIRFLEDMNLPITINGELNEVFKMSSENLKVKYGLTTEEILNKYIVKRIR